MKEIIYTDFYGFRANIILNDQIALDDDIQDTSSETKNRIFLKFIEELEAKFQLYSKYDKRNYLILHNKTYSNIIHCQLGRVSEKKQNIIDSEKGKFIKSHTEDYPFVNLFIDKKAQKFLVECNCEVFQNSATTGKVISNIINKILKKLYNNVKVVILPVTEVKDFWYFFDNKIPVYEMYFNIPTPNAFKSRDFASKIAKSAGEDVNSEEIDLIFKNKKGKLTPNKEAFDSFLGVATTGGGRWKIRYKDIHGKRRSFYSNQNEKKISIPIFTDDFNSEVLRDEKVANINNAFNSIEYFDYLKNDKN